MGQRLALQSLLETLAPNVYFQPPPEHLIEYPCIVYNLSDEDADYADNLPWLHKKRYSVKVIDRDPDSDIPEKVRALPTAAFDRFYTAENLNHFAYNLYF